MAMDRVAHLHRMAGFNLAAQDHAVALETEFGARKDRSLSWRRQRPSAIKGSACFRRRGRPYKGSSDSGRDVGAGSTESYGRLDGVRMEHPVDALVPIIAEHVPLDEVPGVVQRRSCDPMVTRRSCCVRLPRSSGSVPSGLPALQLTSALAFGGSVTPDLRDLCRPHRFAVEALPLESARVVDKLAEFQGAHPWTVDDTDDPVHGSQPRRFQELSRTRRSADRPGTKPRRARRFRTGFVAGSRRSTSTRSVCRRVSAVRSWLKRGGDHSWGLSWSPFAGAKIGFTGGRR